MKIAMIIVRTLMGLMLVAFSAMFFLNLMPPPKNLPEPMVTYNKGLEVVHMMMIVKFIELICGLMFLIGRFTKLAAVLIFPILINIVLLHAVVMPAGLGPGMFLLLGDLFLAWYYRETYAPLFAAK